MKKTNIIIMLSLIAIFIGMPKADAATITVCSSGCNHTIIQQAITDATSGDTISVSAGQYAGFDTIPAGKALNIIGVGAVAVEGSHGQTAIISNVTLPNTGAVSIENISFQSAPITVSGTGKVTFKNCYITSLTAGASSTVVAEYNFWGTSPNFSTIIPSGTVDHDPYYTKLAQLGTYITEIEQTKTQLQILLGSKHTITTEMMNITGDGNYDGDITWAVDCDKATVDTKGVITAAKEGTAVVTASVAGETYTFTFDIVTELNPETSRETNIIVFSGLIIVGVYIALRSYKKSQVLN